MYHVTVSFLCSLFPIRAIHDNQALFLVFASTSGGTWCKIDLRAVDSNLHVLCVLLQATVEFSSLSCFFFAKSKNVKVLGKILEGLTFQRDNQID